jgi:hypothetical protein
MLCIRYAEGLSAQSLAFVLTLQRYLTPSASSWSRFSIERHVAVHTAVHPYSDRHWLGAGGYGSAHHLRPLARAGRGQAWHRSAAFRRGAGDPHGDIGLFSPPLDLGLCGACLIGKVPIEQTVEPILGYLGLLFLCLLLIAFVPALSTALPRALDIDAAKILLTLTPETRAKYYGERADRPEKPRRRNASRRRNRTIARGSRRCPTRRGCDHRQS